ncbi:hypothetical protein V9K67_11060 [Paraflavisolibacter sp. H34]|uniref:hypothetical protein n=1 Tax=Huijunlia imazamoxiresistens TaxID=3127457 RepID=UPI0030179517
MRKPIALALIATVLAVVAYVTKPSEEKCREEAAKDFAQKAATTADALPPNINPGVWQQAAEKAFMESVQVEDHFLFRSIYRQSGPEKKRIGWAALGKVQVDSE